MDARLGESAPAGALFFQKHPFSALLVLKNLTSLSLPFTGYQDEGLKNVDMPLLSKPPLKSSE